ncbi:hypothetical protein CONCODRAFT_11007 [Conidiobolus coronatus NRRL 28638]|uniref:Uncharacterized protein n=1 Tax=Conidiobolus coronatus (strain ATCC 28846 / CBS 209.66 / NRRL 28638) TaxID=796925 RepID=A0A137NW12_CONC2|nr:hypothetical protein CONCODRAFT_11007 [Conidiobolus coronatus NRRL 28638]|eukprot:KXN67025.1 hypothetical protein CONCODRAFT_11007 [Conidiobolus coronatus NRRL 28638]
MTNSSQYTLTYKSESNDGIYLVKSAKQSYEFSLEQKKSLKLINPNGNEALTTESKSFFNDDLKLNLPLDNNFHGVEFVQKGDCSGYKVKGRYNATPIDWKWKKNHGGLSFQLIDKSDPDSIIADIRGFTLREASEGHMTINNLENAYFEELLIGTGCLIYQTEKILKKRERDRKPFGQLETFKKFSK